MRDASAMDTDCSALKSGFWMESPDNSWSSKMMLASTGRPPIVTLGSDHSSHCATRVVDHVVMDHGVLANDELYHQLVPCTVNAGEVDHEALVEGRPQTVHRIADGRFRLFRIGDAVAGRNIHAAVYDALRLCKDL